MGKKVKLPFLNKITSYSSSSSSWPSASCHQQNPKKIFFRDFFTINKPKNVNKPEPPSRSLSSSSTTTNNMEKPREIECIENVIRGLKSSKRLIFERRGRSNSILEEVTKRDEEEDAPEEEEGFMLLSLESNDPYSDFKKSMEKMVDLHALHHDWRRLEELLFLLLKVNVKTSHKYICAAFVDLLLNLAVESSKDVAQEPRPVLVEESPSSPLSFYTSYSSSDETSPTSLRVLPENLIGEKRRDVVCCLSSLFEMEEKIKDSID
ncbi:Transcription repressor OFP18 [Raphanus sativus]|uniref:Transcription repressor n=1 Tax=Raphanus sativus TaxID=3726 RepID=A0A6J0JR08_RAPSA|nr:transcription repressor OFP18 [Raphanus sativus]KAJ4890085.1 Transcription repressor OFP18 [Raphanus sativus]